VYSTTATTATMGTVSSYAIRYDGGTGDPYVVVYSTDINGTTVPYIPQRSAPREWTVNIPADPQPSKDQLRRIQLREWSWAAIARRERDLLCERRPAPAMPPRPRPGRRRVTSPAERYRVLV
jgi:hypothetical protein